MKCKIMKKKEENYKEKQINKILLFDMHSLPQLTQLGLLL